MVERKAILVVDADPLQCGSLAMALKRKGYRVVTAPNGEQAAQCLGERPFDLVFLDLKLPDQNGIEFLAQLQESYPGLPVIVMSSFAAQQLAEKAKLLGARGFLLKPLHIERATGRAAELLREQELVRIRLELHQDIQDLTRLLNGHESYPTAV